MKRTSLIRLNMKRGMAYLVPAVVMAHSFVSMSAYAQESNDVVISKDDLNLPGANDQIGSGDVQAVLNIVYLVAGITAVVVIIIGGIRYVTSDGDSSGIAAAKNTVMYAVVGLVVVIAAAAITNFVIQNVA